MSIDKISKMKVPYWSCDNIALLDNTNLFMILLKIMFTLKIIDLNIIVALKITYNLFFMFYDGSVKVWRDSPVSWYV